MSTKKQTTSQIHSSFFSLSSYRNPTLSYRSVKPYFETITTIYALFVLAIFPLLVGFESYYDITGSKYAIFKFSVYAFLILCVLTTVSLLLDKKTLTVWKSEGLQKFNITQIILLCYLLWCSLTAILSKYDDVWIGQSRYEGLCAILLYGITYSHSH